jgi:hypothetical protein
MISSLDFLVVLFIVDSLALVSLKEYRSVACMTKCADAIHSSFIHLVEIFNSLAGNKWARMNARLRVNGCELRSQGSTSYEEGSIFKLVIYTSLLFSLDYYGLN